MRWTSRLWFFFFKPAWYGRIHFFFLSCPFNHPRFLQLVFLKTKTNYWATFHSIRQGSSNYYPTAAQCSPIIRATNRFNYRGLTEEKKKSYAKSCWNFKFGASWVIANRIIYLSLSLSLSPHLVLSPNFYFLVPRSFPQISHYPCLRRCKCFIQSRIYLLRVNASPQPIWEGVTCVQDRPLLGNLFHK